jgi:hypothetical protein
MKPSIFLSHNIKDKDFVRKLALDLDCHGLKVWLDEAELKIGDSLIEKIREGIDSVDYVAVVLSPNSIQSKWVQKEIDVAMTLEISGKEIKVLPLMLERCELPGFLLGKFYADFTQDSKYLSSFELLTSTMGIVFNKSVLLGKSNAANLGQAIEKASNQLLFFYPKPFHRPFQYIGMSIADAAKEIGKSPNKVGNIIIDTDDCHMFLEAEGNFVNYVEVDIKKASPCLQNQEFDSEPLLGCLSINPSELDLVAKKPHYHHYSDHKRKLKISVSCSYDGGPLSVGFSAKYYNM